MWRYPRITYDRTFRGLPATILLPYTRLLIHALANTIYVKTHSPFTPYLLWTYFYYPLYYFPGLPPGFLFSHLDIRLIVFWPGLWTSLDLAWSCHANRNSQGLTQGLPKDNAL